MVSKEAVQLEEVGTVKAYVVASENGSTVYVYIKSAITNQYRQYARLDFKSDTVSQVRGAANLLTFSEGSLYFLTMRDSALPFRPPTGEYVLNIDVLRERSFSFRILLNITLIVLNITHIAYRLFDQAYRNQIQTPK